MPDRIRLEGDLIGNLQQMGPRNKRAMVAGANYVAPKAVSLMRTRAPWTDRTGNARSGLNAKVVVSTNKVAIVLYHSVPYGIWLEVRWGGKYAAIKPIIPIVAKDFVETVGKLMFK